MHPISAMPRRHFLRGLGTLLALPVFESLVPARLWAAQMNAGAGSPLLPKRLVYTFAPNGQDMERWWPDGSAGADYEMPYILQPLQDYKSDFLLVRGLQQHNGSSMGDGGGDHARANATYLTGARPLKSATSVHLGISADQLAANQIGHLTKLPSLELGCEIGPRGGCDTGYSCAYQFNLSWRSETEPIAPEVNPRVAFERLFGDPEAITPAAKEAKARRILYNNSVLDFVSDDAQKLDRRLGYTDKAKLDQYLTAVREVEQRINFVGPPPPAGVTAPSGDTAGFEDLANVMFDLQTLALRTDSTRIITFSYGHDGQNRPYPQLGITEGHHDLSHHRNIQERKDKVAQINRFHATLFAGFLKRLKSIPEGAGTLLDNCMVVYGSAISDGNSHFHYDLPVLVAGTVGGALKTGQYLDLGGRTEGNCHPMNDLHLSLLNILGAPVPHFGDSTGQLTQVLA